MTDMPNRPPMGPTVLGSIPTGFEHLPNPPVAQAAEQVLETRRFDGIRRNAMKVVGGVLVAATIALAAGGAYELVNDDSTPKTEKAEEAQTPDGKIDPIQLAANSETITELNPLVCPEGIYKNGLYAASKLEVITDPLDLHKQPKERMKTKEALLEENVGAEGVVCNSVATTASWGYALSNIYGEGAISLYKDGVSMDDYVKLLEKNPEAAMVVANEVATLMDRYAQPNKKAVTGKIYQFVGIQNSDGTVTPKLQKSRDFDAKPGDLWEFAPGRVVDDSGEKHGNLENMLWVDPITGQVFSRENIAGLEEEPTTTTTTTTTTTEAGKQAGTTGGDNKDNKAGNSKSATNGNGGGGGNKSGGGGNGCGNGCGGTGANGNTGGGNGGGGNGGGNGGGGNGGGGGGHNNCPPGGCGGTGTTTPDTTTPDTTPDTTTPKTVPTTTAKPNKDKDNCDSAIDVCK